MISVNPVRGVESVTPIGLLFSTINQGNTLGSQVRKDSVHVSPIGRLFLDLEGITNPFKIELRLRQASGELRVCEADVRKYVKNKNFLARIGERGGYENVSDFDKSALLARLVSYGFECPALAALSWKNRNGKTLIDFETEDITMTFGNEYRASKMRIKEFEKRYSYVF